MDSRDDKPTPADDAPETPPGGAQQDDGPRADEEPLHGWMMADSEANQATVFAPDGPASPSRKRRRSLIAAVVCAALVIVVAVAVHVMGKQRERRLLDMEPQSGPAPLATPVGYSGEARATGAPSPAWARGVATAWRINEKLDETFPEYGARLAVEGSRMYVVTLSSVRAYDISGSKPALLWNSPLTSEEFAPKPIVWGDRLVVGRAILTADSGQVVSSLPSAIEGTAVGVVDSVLVVCGELSKQCWGVDASLNRLWTAEGPGWRCPGVFQTASAGGRTWIHFGFAEYKDFHTVVEARTGATAELGFEAGTPSLIRPAANGWLVEGDHSTFMTAEADGTVRQTFTLAKGDPAAGDQPVVPGGQPTVEQWERYYGSADASWALGVLGATGEGCRTLTFGDSSVDLISDRVRSAYGRFQGHEEDPCWVKTPFSASPDASVLFYPETRTQTPGGLPEEVRRFYFVAVKEGYLVRLDPSQDVYAGVLAFDDLYVGVTPRGIVAITPRGA